MHWPWRPEIGIDPDWRKEEEEAALIAVMRLDPQDRSVAPSCWVRCAPALRRTDFRRVPSVGGPSVTVTTIIVAPGAWIDHVDFTQAPAGIPREFLAIIHSATPALIAQPAPMQSARRASPRKSGSRNHGICVSTCVPAPKPSA